MISSGSCFEPYVKEINGQEVTQSYLGAWDVFHQYDESWSTLWVETNGRITKKTTKARTLGWWYPNMVGEDGYYEEDMTNDESKSTS